MGIFVSTQPNNRILKGLISILVCLCSSYCSIGQNHIIPFKEDPSISDKAGNPATSTTYYFPVETFRDTTHWVWCYDSTRVRMVGYFPKYERTINEDCKYGQRSLKEFSEVKNIPLSEIKDTLETKIDSSELDWFSDDLYKMKEPVLYNYNLGKEVYRFTWLRSFNQPIVISIQKQGEKLTIHTKKLDECVGSETWMHKKLFPFFNSILRVCGNQYEKSIYFLNLKISTHKYQKPIQLSHDKVRDLDTNEFKTLINLINHEKIVSQPHKKRSGCILLEDGSQWILEIQNSNGYYYTHIHSPEENTSLRKIGELMIKMSSLKNEEIY